MFFERRGRECRRGSGGARQRVLPRQTRHPGHFDRAAAVRTRRRRRRREGLVDLFRARTAALPTVACASPPPGTPAATLRPVLGKGGCLSAAGPPRLVELLLEAFAATLPSVPVAGGARQFTTQPADLAVLLLDALVPRITLAPGRLRTAKSATLASHTARIGTCAPNLHTTSRIFSLLPGRVERRRRGCRPWVGSRRILSGNASIPPTIPGFLRALVEPCEPFSSTRLSDWFHVNACDRAARCAAPKWQRPALTPAPARRCERPGRPRPGRAARPISAV